MSKFAVHDQKSLEMQTCRKELISSLFCCVAITVLIAYCKKHACYEHSYLNVIASA